MPPKNRCPHSIWLCPEAPQGDELRAVIKQIAGATGAPVFAPHVTLLGDLTGDPTRSMAVCRELFGSLGSVRAIVSGVSQTDDFFMSLFLDLQLMPALFQLRRRLAERLGVPHTSFRPHLSLAYGLTPEAKQPDDIDALAKRFGGVDFCLGQICVVASAREIPIHEWQVLDSAALRPGT